MRAFCQISFLGIAVFFCGVVLVVLGFAAPIWTSIACRLNNETTWGPDIAHIGLFIECLPTAIDGDMRKLSKYDSCIFECK
jgi:hypothetical protein